MPHNFRLTEEKHFGPVWFIPGESGGRYPFCNSVYIEGAGIIIDPSSDRKRLMALKDEPGVKESWLTHWHEDHLMHLDLFDDLPMSLHELDAPPLTDLELFLDAYNMSDEQEREKWRQVMKGMFNFRPRTPARTFTDREVLELPDITVEVLHTPGHTPGSLSFFFREQEVLFMGDYDLTKFGPWYGDRFSDIDDLIASVNRLRQVPAKVWLAGHEHGLFEENPDRLWDEFLAVIDRREEKLLNFLTEPRSMKDIINQWIVNRKPKEPKEFFEFGERAIMGKHLERMMARGIVGKTGKFFALV